MDSFTSPTTLNAAALGTRVLNTSILGTGEIPNTTSWVFDLDNTLYPASCDLFSQVSDKMTHYVADILNLDREEALRVQKSYFREFGTTLRGLMTNHGVEPTAYMEFVHDIDLTAIVPNPKLDAALGRLNGRKIIFTNGSTAHARRVMKRLGVEQHFESVHDIADADYIPKPEPVVYEGLVQRFKLDPKCTVMVEDMARNLEPAAAMGMTCVWLNTENDWGQEGSDQDYVHHKINDLTDWVDGLSR